MRALRIFLLLAAICFSSCSGKRSSKTYSVAVDPFWFPMQLNDQAFNVLAFSIELLTTIAREENFQLTLKRMNWNNLMWGLEEKKYDAILSSMRPFAFHDEYSFSTPYLLTGPSIVTPIKGGINDPKDLAGKAVGVVKGSSAALILQTVPGIILRAYDSIPFALKAIETIEVRAAALERINSQAFVRDLYRDTLKMIQPPLSNEGLRVVTLYEHFPQLLKRFDEGIDRLKKSGKYEALIQKWGLSPDGKSVSQAEAKAYIQSIMIL